MPVKEIKIWADKVIQQLQNVSDLNKDEFIFLAGEKYRRFLLPYISHYQVPMKGLSIGKQLKYLKDKLQNESDLL